MKKFLNPFHYLAGGGALAWGLIVLILTCILSWQTGVVARGNMSIGYTQGYVSLLAVTVRMLCIWLVFATLLYIAGRLLSKSKIRAVDVYGTNLFASIPLSAAMAVSALPPLTTLSAEIESSMGDLARLEALSTSPALIFMVIVLLVTIVWYFWWSYSAFSVSANLHGVKAVASYIACFVIAQIIYGPLSQAFYAVGIR